MKKSLFCALAATAAVSLAGTAAAEVVAFEFCGHATFSTPFLRSGMPVSGTFSWNTSAAPAEGTNQSFYNGSDTGPFDFMAGHHSVASGNVGVTVWNDTGSNVGDMIDINGYQPVVDGKPMEQGYFSIRLATAWSNTSVFQDTRLPAELDITRFDSIGMNYFQMYSGVAPNDLLLDVALDWIRPAGDPMAGRSERRECKPAGN